MQLHLDVDGIFLNLAVKGYRRNNRTEYGCTWCQVDFSLVAGDWLNFSRRNDEILTAEEVDDFIVILERLLKNELESSTEMGFAEPDFLLKFYPKNSRQGGPQMEWQIRFWNQGGLTENYFSLKLGTAEIEAVWVYLKFVQGTLPEKDVTIQKLLEQGTLR